MSHFSTALLPAPVLRATEQTLKASIGCVGVGVHSGQRVRVTLSPAPLGHGIVFHRSDLGVSIAARFDNVVDTKLCTVLGSPTNPSARVGTVEHLMAAISAAGITNLLVSVDGPELPILDGSAANWSFLIDCAGISAENAGLQSIQVLRPVRVQDAAGGFAELAPSDSITGGMMLKVSIDFPHAVIGSQAYSLQLTEAAFRREVARARTFGFAEEIEALQAAGLARGGSLDNAIVVRGDSILNPGGLRYKDEFARHKLLDAVGDLALAGAPLVAHFTGHRCGHALNNQVLRALFADQANWRWSPSEAWSQAA